MPPAKKGDKVKVHYTGKLKDDVVFDSSKGKDPLEFMIGQKSVIPGFEEAVIGMNPGDKTSVHIVSDQAYGPRKENLVVETDRSQIPADIKLEVGMRLESVDETGKRFPVTIVNLTDEKITLDANHPLAGQDLYFDIELVEIAAED